MPLNWVCLLALSIKAGTSKANIDWGKRKESTPGVHICGSPAETKYLSIIPVFPEDILHQYIQRRFCTG